MAVSHFADVLIFFGNSDIVIMSDCDKEAISYCNLGQTYLPPKESKSKD